MGTDNLWPEEDIERLRELKSSNLSFTEIGKEMGRSRNSVRNKWVRMGEQEHAAPPTHLPPGATQALDKISEVSIEAEEFLVASDFHVPGEDRRWIKRLLDYGKKNGVTTLVINGDFWNHDSVSRWQFKDPSMGLKLEIKKGIALVKELQQQFKLYFVCGNHDSRLPKALNYALNFSDWMDALFGDEIVVTDFDFMRVKSGKREFRVCHPEYYSRVKGSEATTLAHDLQENIIMAHQHFLTMTTNKTGRYLCVDCGCMCDQDVFYYKKSATSKFPSWENGFVHIKGGKVRLVCDYTF